MWVFFSFLGLWGGKYWIHDLLLRDHLQLQMFGFDAHGLYSSGDVDDLGQKVCFGFITLKLISLCHPGEISRLHLTRRTSLLARRDQFIW